MADLAITATLVAPSSPASIQTKKTIGETLLAGEVVYAKSADTRYWKAQADGGAEEIAAVGIALNGGAAGQYFQFQDSGDITLGATLVVGTEYYLSAAAGKACPRADLVTGNRIFRLGFGKSATVLTLDLKDLGIMP